MIFIASRFGFLPAEYFGDAAVGHLEDAGNVARARSRVGQFDDLLPRRVGQRTAVDVDASQLVDAAVTYMTNIRNQRERQRQRETKMKELMSFESLQIVIPSVASSFIWGR